MPFSRAAASPAGSAETDVWSSASQLAHGVGGGLPRHVAAGFLRDQGPKREGGSAPRVGATVFIT